MKEEALVLVSLQNLFGAWATLLAPVGLSLTLANGD